MCSSSSCFLCRSVLIRECSSVSNKHVCFLSNLKAFTLSYPGLAFKPANRFPAEKGLGPSNLRMGDDATREKAFLALLYLMDRLSLDVKELEVWCRCAPFYRLSTITREIRYAEPMLRGLIPDVLLGHHQCAIKLYRDLEEGLEAGAYPGWKPTHFSNIARELSIMENNNGLIRLTLQHKENKRKNRKMRKVKSPVY